MAVSVDEAQTEGRRATFVLNFQGALARTDIADITTHFGSGSEAARNLSLAVVKPSNLAQGAPRTGEVQRIVASAQVATPAWTLSLTHQGKTATSQAIDADMSREEVQAEVDAMMAALNTAIGNGFAASATVEFWSGRALELRFAGSLLGVDVAALQVTDAPRVEDATLSVQQAGSTTIIEAVPERTLVVDYAAGKTDLEVRNGSAAGDVLELTDEGLAATGRVPAGYLYVDGIVGDVGQGVLRDRQVLAEEGVVVVVVTVDVSTGKVLTGPEIITRGWVYAPEAEDLLDEACDTVAGAVERALASGVRDVESLERDVRRAAGKFVSDRTKRRPMIVPVVMEA